MFFETFENKTFIFVNKLICYKFWNLCAFCSVLLESYNQQIRRCFEKQWLGMFTAKQIFRLHHRVNKFFIWKVILLNLRLSKYLSCKQQYQPQNTYSCFFHDKTSLIDFIYLYFSCLMNLTLLC